MESNLRKKFLNESEKELFEYEKEYQMTTFNLNENLAENLAFRKIESVRKSAKKVVFAELPYKADLID